MSLTPKMLLIILRLLKYTQNFVNSRFEPTLYMRLRNLFPARVGILIALMLLL